LADGALASDDSAPPADGFTFVGGSVGIDIDSPSWRRVAQEERIVDFGRSRDLHTTRPFYYHHSHENCFSFAPLQEFQRNARGIFEDVGHFVFSIKVNFHIADCTPNQFVLVCSLSLSSHRHFFIPLIFGSHFDS